MTTDVMPTNVRGSKESVKRREAEGRYPDGISGQVLNGPIAPFERNGIEFPSITAVNKSGGGSVQFVARGGYIQEAIGLTCEEFRERFEIAESSLSQNGRGR
jgi:hypothetical protein